MAVPMETTQATTASATTTQLVTVTEPDMEATTTEEGVGPTPFVTPPPLPSV